MACFRLLHDDDDDDIYWSIEEAGKEATCLRSYIPSTSLRLRLYVYVFFILHVVLL